MFMKKYLLIIVSIFVISIVTSKDVYADYGDSGLGVSFYGGLDGNIGGSFTFKFDDLPIMFGLGISQILNDPLNRFLIIDATTDWWLANLEIGGPFNFYFGIGGYYSFYIREDETSFDFDLGLRLPLGISIVFDFFEVYGEIAPGLHILKAGTGVSTKFFQGNVFRFLGQTGVRFWF